MTNEEHAKRMRAWRAQNKEKVRANNRKAYVKNREVVLEKKRAYYQTVRREKDKTSHGRVRDRLRKAKRRAAIKTDIVTPDEWRALLKSYNWSCAYCFRYDLPLEMDHVIPLSRGGRHLADNIVPACKPCNSSKGAKCG